MPSDSIRRPLRNRTRAVKRVSCEDAHARFRSVVLPRLNDAYALARWLAGEQSRRLRDVVQNACLCALRAIDTFSDGNARTWMLTIIAADENQLSKCKRGPVPAFAPHVLVELAWE